ncbi:adenylyl-sulfate kinase [Umezawaea endophytica]|uniref:Adenylyl-sulfate kinase n=1 Tax=Umezawaea endophytica TaxID=1654476 RepID=A0A9X2VJ19_9PSEU|nr:adenylyl-sulfate kinase [Umezawaea endophytica]MCS7477024.1 adenylyl-sulfate kinase [Umezawaea endophytica]
MIGVDAGVVWVTGLSGAGKSTVTSIVSGRLTAAGRRPVVLDGDRMRLIMPTPPGYTEPERRRTAVYYSRLAHELADQGHLVLCATISLFHDVHRWNRENIKDYLEIWLRVPLTTLKDREGRAAFYDHRSLAPDQAPLRNVVGVDAPAQFPHAADLVIDNFGDTTADAAADRVMDAITGRRS